MKIAFDLDGTISRDPVRMAAIAKALVKDGHRVFVLTAAAGELPPADRPAEVRRRLDKLGFNGIPVICTETAHKPVDCQAYGVDVLIDDTPFHVKNVLQLIPL